MTAATEDLEAKAARLPTVPVAPGAVAVAGDTDVRLVVAVLGEPVCTCPAAHYRKQCSHVLAATDHLNGDSTMSNALEATTDRDLAQQPFGHLADIPPRLRELGRIRLGEQVPTGSGDARPKALDRFRLTSPSRPRIEAAAGLYGGRPGEWTPPDANAPSWEVVVEVDELPVAFAPGLPALTQAYELWSGGGCQRRCDGRIEELSEQACMCPPAGPDRAAAAADGEACSPTSRLSVLLPDLPGLGVWRLESHGFYAASELAGTAALLGQLTASGTVVHGQLRIDRRSVKRPGEARRDFTVPVVELGITVGQLLEHAEAGPPVLDGPDQPQLDQAPDERSADPDGSPEQPSPRERAEVSGDMPEDRNVQAEQVLRRLEEAGVTSEAFHALLAARYRGAVHIDQLEDHEVAALWRVTGTDQGLSRLAAACAADLATGGPDA